MAVLLSRETADRLHAALDRLDETPRNVVKGGRVDHAPSDPQWIEISSTVTTDGRYPGRWYTYSASAKTWTQRATIWVVAPNGETLTTGTKYLARLQGRDGPSGDKRAIYQVVPTGATGTEYPLIAEATTVAALPAYTFDAGNNRLTATANGALTVDGRSMLVNYVVLLQHAVNSAHNGLYFVEQVGDASNPWKLKRTTTADSAGDLFAGMLVFVEGGNTWPTTLWANQNDVAELNVSAVTFKQLHPDATTAVRGLVSTAAQTWAGTKTLDESSWIVSATNNSHKVRVEDKK